MTEGEKEHLARTANFVAVKLASVHNHLQRYEAIEDEVIALARTAPPPTPPVLRVVEVSQDLFLELDEFLVQLKSTLDYLVKTPIPIVGRKNWTLRRFGNEGEDLRHVLVRNTPKEHKEWAGLLVEQLVDRHKPWLHTAIGLRDELNHFLEGSVPIDRFAIYLDDPQDPDSVHRPMWDGSTTVAAALRILWQNLFDLVEDFVPLFLERRRKKGYAFLKNPPSSDPNAPRWVAGLDEDLQSALARAIAGKASPAP